MMGFEKFTEHVLEVIHAKVGGAFQIKKQMVRKNNNVKLTGIMVVKGEADIGPCVYLDAFYRDYETDGMRLEEIVDEVYRLIVKNDGETLDFDIAGLKKWETVWGNVYAKLINAEQNKELLGRIPHRNFMDLAVVYYAVARDHAQKDIGTILIYNGHMEMWGQEEENLYRTAMMNMRADGEVEFAAVETIIKHMEPDITFPSVSGNVPRDTRMYILTNRRKCFGAAEILDKKILWMIADKIGDGFLVLPSSVHETVVLPPRDESEYERLADMVRVVNNTQVDVEERLSCHVYAYSRDEETLKIVA